MIKKTCQILFALVFFASFSLPGQASEGGTREEAISMVNAVVKMAEADGNEATFKAVTAQKFVDRDLYPFMFTMDGTIVAHGVKAALVGKNLLNMQDPDGTFFIKEMVKVAQAGGGDWVNYKWPNPTTNKIENKSAYIAKIGPDHFVGVGIHPK